MKAPKSLFDRPGRAAAVVGAVVAVSATATVALLSGTATAAPGVTEPGRCTKNVNVRAEPDIAAKIVALCEEGPAVPVGEARDGFLQLTTLGGWAAQDRGEQYLQGLLLGRAERRNAEHLVEQVEGATPRARVVLSD